MQRPHTIALQFVLDSQLLDAMLSDSLQINELHGQTHVTGNFDFALEESLLWVDLALNQLGHVLIVDNKGNVWLFGAVVGDFTFSSFCVDHPVDLIQVKSSLSPTIQNYFFRLITSSHWLHPVHW